MQEAKLKVVVVRNLRYGFGWSKVVQVEAGVKER